MLEYLNDQHKRFFTWCDNAVRDHIDHEGTILKQWRPRKNPDSSYDLVFELVAHDEPVSRFNVPVPEEFHELLEREYFINHQHRRRRGELVLIINNNQKNNLK